MTVNFEIAFEGYPRYWRGSKGNKIEAIVLKGTDFEVPAQTCLEDGESIREERPLKWSVLKTKFWHPPLSTHLNKIVLSIEEANKIKLQARVWTKSIEGFYNARIDTQFPKFKAGETYLIKLRSTGKGYIAASPFLIISRK